MPAADAAAGAGPAGKTRPGTLKIVGITRYSVIYLRSFAATRGLDEAQARAVIWHPDRLAHRDRLFRSLALPSLDAMAERYDGFSHIVLISEGFPEPFRSMLDAIVARRPWLHLVEMREGEDFSAAKPKLAEIVADARAYVFRLDDDDALAPQAFIDTIVSNGDAVPGTVLSTDEGYMLRPAWNGVALRRIRIPFVSAGLGLYTEGPAPQSIHDLGNQNKIAGQGNPVIHARVPTWLRTKHGTSDTVMKSWKRWLYWPTSPGQVKRRLADEFPGVDPALAIAAVIGSSS